MMFAWLFPPPPERRLLPGGRFSGPTPFVIAIMTFAMMIVAAAGLALSNAATLVAGGIDNRYSVEIPAGSRDLPKILIAVRKMRGVLRAEPVPETEMRKTLEKWLGPSGNSQDLPVPALITLDLADSADRAALAAQVKQLSRGARLVAHEEVLTPLLRSVRALQGLALALVVLMAAATSATVVLAARGALDTHRSTIDVMHGIGATDLQVTRLFQRKIALDAMVGGFAGSVAAGLTIIIIVGGGAALAGDLTGTAPLHGRDILILALLPLLLVLLATGVARIAVLAALRKSI